MDYLYALGVYGIQVVQSTLYVCRGFFWIVNWISTPNHALEYWFPVVSIVDSVFASQLVLVTAFGGWLNAILKWWILDHRPYWWVNETEFYQDSNRPFILQTSQTCDSGPGCPSGHTQTAVTALVLIDNWIAQLVLDKKISYPDWWDKAWSFSCGFVLGSVMLARIYVGTHFPHQVVSGAMLGFSVATWICTYVSGPRLSLPEPRIVATHCGVVLGMIIFTVLTYNSLCWGGIDPYWTVTLATRWCANREWIDMSTSPMYALATYTGHALGWALAVTSVDRYRYHTNDRSLYISVMVTCIITYLLRDIKNMIPKDNHPFYYSIIFIIGVVKVPALLQLAPHLAMYSYDQTTKPQPEVEPNPLKPSDTKQRKKK